MTHQQVQDRIKQVFDILSDSHCECTTHAATANKFLAKASGHVGLSLSSIHLTIKALETHLMRTQFAIEELNAMRDQLK